MDFFFFNFEFNIVTRSFFQGELKKYQIQTSIKKSPNLLEIAAFGYFFCGTFTGPLFTLSRFRSFVAGEYLDSKKEVRISGLVLFNL